MRTVAAGVLFAWLFLGTWCTQAGADGGTIRLSSQQSGYQITVFTAPTPFRAGPVDISVLVQDSSTGEPMTAARVTVRISKPGQLALEYPATTAAATNKLFQAAQFELPEPGRWDLQVRLKARMDWPRSPVRSKQPSHYRAGGRSGRGLAGPCCRSHCSAFIKS